MSDGLLRVLFTGISFVFGMTLALPDPVLAQVENQSEMVVLSGAPDFTTSLPSRLNDYRESYLSTAALINEQNVAARSLIRLQNLSEQQRATEFPTGGYEDALIAATELYEHSAAAARASQTETDAFLLALTDGRAMSADDLRDLHTMLGL